MYDAKINVPIPVLDWFEKYHYKVLDTRRPVGNFAADVVQVSVITPDKEQTSLILKKIPANSLEGSAYARADKWLGKFTPRTYAILPVGTGYALLLEAFGESLEAALSNFDPRRLPINVLTDAAIWLANMHIDLAHFKESLRSAGFPKSYPLETAAKWRHTALQQLAWAEEEHLLSKGTLTDIRAMATELANSLAVSSWLWTHLFADERHLTVTHGDCHFGNLVLKDDAYRLIDWEYAALAHPQRDLSVFLQNIHDVRQQEIVYKVFHDCLRDSGWQVDTPSYPTIFNFYFFENTLMMLGWEIEQSRRNQDDRATLYETITAKIGWLETSHRRLFSQR